MVLSWSGSQTYGISIKLGRNGNLSLKLAVNIVVLRPFSTAVLIDRVLICVISKCSTRPAG